MGNIFYLPKNEGQIETQPASSIDMVIRKRAKDALLDLYPFTFKKGDAGTMIIDDGVGEEYVLNNIDQVIQLADMYFIGRAEYFIFKSDWLSIESLSPIILQAFNAQYRHSFIEMWLSFYPFEIDRLKADECRIK